MGSFRIEAVLSPVEPLWRCSLDPNVGTGGRLPAFTTSAKTSYEAVARLLDLIARHLRELEKLP